MFQKYPKTPRLSSEVVVTEKIDGTNAHIHVVKGEDWIPTKHIAGVTRTEEDEPLFLLAGSRSRYLSEEADNFGFWQWCRENADELFKLGPGRHYGEWWGQGIQRGYGLEEKRFSLFNVSRWEEDETRLDYRCFDVPVCYVVPTLVLDVEEEGDLHAAAQEGIDALMAEGSFAVEGYDKPEGVIIWHKRANRTFKAYCPGEG